MKSKSSLPVVATSLALLVAGYAAVACAAPLEQGSPIAQGDTPEPSRSPIVERLLDAGAPAPPSTVDAGADAAADAALANTGCGPDVAGAIFCDSFEGSDIGATWNQNLQSGDAELTGDRALTGGQSLILGFSPLPAKGKAQLSFRNDATAAASLVSFRFHVFLPRDGYPSSLPIGGFFDGAGAGLRLELDGSGTLVASDTSGARVASFDYTLGAWSCVAITVDRKNGRVSVSLDGARKSGTLSSAATVDRPTIGLTYDEGANDGASTAGWFDDVAIATSDLACE